MSTTKHTPGPWEWQIHDHSMASLGVGDSPGHGTPLVLSISPCRSCVDRAEKGEWRWGLCTTPSEADAHLIAAAPDLLEALKMARKHMKRAPFNLFKAIDAAISKAEGR